MPLLAPSGSCPIPPAGSHSLPRAAALAQSYKPNDFLRIALVNNMPDAALEDTELQFFELLSAAAGDLPIQVELFSLPGIPRGEHTREHLNQYYQSTTALLNQSVDGVIITGTEPRQPELRDEPYWGSLTDLFSWAEENTCSAVLSCLAAHAGVLQSDGIRRHPLSEKRFGVFEHEIVSNHPLTGGFVRPVRNPHSRWNELRRGDLESAGYTVLTESPRAGVDFFVKEKKKSLFVHFQGHPEYLSLTLHKEYRRDVKRYLRRERENYPLIPEGYFDEDSVRLLSQFQEKAEGQRLESAMELFPEDQIVRTLQHTWRPVAQRIYQNWLNYLLARKARSLSTSFLASVGQG